MHFLAVTASVYDEFWNRLFSVIGPLLFLYAPVSIFAGEKTAQQLLKNDNFCEDTIRIRPYFVFSRLFVMSVFSWAFILALQLKAYSELIVCMLIFAGYAGMFICLPCLVRVRYTSDYVSFVEWRKEYTIPMCNITKITWERIGRSLDYSLVIYTDGGREITLHSAYYIGLNRLRALYDSLQEENI